MSDLAWLATFWAASAAPGRTRTTIALLTFAERHVENVPRTQAELVRLHPGFQAGITVVLHRFSSHGPAYTAFCSKLLGLQSNWNWDGDPVRRALEAAEVGGDGPIRALEIDGKQFELSARNTTPMFGAGLIDSIPVAAIRRTADLETLENPQVHGKFVGRFGWRGQIMNLHEFNRGACAIELGLEVHRQPQAVDPSDSAAKSSPNSKPDLTTAQFEELSRFVAGLPPPRRLWPTDPEELRAVKVGEKQFARSGFAVCHRPTLGNAHGLYSDLLIHDMGQQLYDPSPASSKAAEPTFGVSQYYGNVQLSVIPSGVTQSALYRMWRTPPLWGLRDSGPYLHDGRAATVEEAILAHGGEATDSLAGYQSLLPEEREHLLLFLQSLAAPDPASLPRRLEPARATTIAWR